MHTIIEDKDFNDFVSSSPKVLIKFFATWCGPCRMVSMILEEIEGTALIPEGLKIAEVNVDNSAFLAGKFNIETIPTLIIFENGVEKSRLTGFASKQKIVDFLN